MWRKLRHVAMEKAAAGFGHSFMNSWIKITVCLNPVSTFHDPQFFPHQLQAIQSCLFPLTGVTGPSVTQFNTLVRWLFYPRIIDHLRLDRTFWRSSGPTPPAQAGPAAQDHVQMAFENLCGWRLHNLCGQPVPVLGHAHNEKAFPEVFTPYPGLTR